MSLNYYNGQRVSFTPANKNDYQSMIYTDAQKKYDLQKAFYYFSNELPNTKKDEDIHIVGHSGFMKNIFDDILLKPILNNETIYKNTNKKQLLLIIIHGH